MCRPVIASLTGLALFCTLAGCGAGDSIAEPPGYERTSIPCSDCNSTGKVKREAIGGGTYEITCPNCLGDGYN